MPTVHDERVRDRIDDRDLRGEVDDAVDWAVHLRDRRERREDAVRDIAVHDLEGRLGAVERVLGREPAREV